MKIKQSTLIWQFVSSNVIWIIKVVLYISCYPCIIQIVQRVTLCKRTSLWNDDIVLDLLIVFYYATQFKFVFVETDLSYYDPQLPVLPSIPGSLHSSLDRAMLERFQHFSCKILRKGIKHLRYEVWKAE